MTSNYDDEQEQERLEPQKQLEEPESNELKSDREDEPVATDNEEFAAEIAASPMGTGMNERPVALKADADAEPEERGRGVGFVALALAILSFFVLPMILGPAAAIIGFIAWRQGRRALGVWSIALGLIAFFAYLFLVPMYA